jgi:hypothetical protein
MKPVIARSDPPTLAAQASEGGESAEAREREGGSDEAIQFAAPWIASLVLAMTRTTPSPA